MDAVWHVVWDEGGKPSKLEAKHVVDPPWMIDGPVSVEVWAPGVIKHMAFVMCHVGSDCLYFFPS